MNAIWLCSLEARRKGIAPARRHRQRMLLEKLRPALPADPTWGKPALIHAGAVSFLD
jgi:hypothetical protein